MTTSSRRSWDPRTLGRLRRLGLRAAGRVEGLVGGLHASHLRGSSVDFLAHREYAPGDDVRDLDWKVRARTDRWVVKEYEQETNLDLSLVIDASESMGFGSVETDGDETLTKFDYAAWIAATLAALALRQRDQASVHLLAGGQAHGPHLPPGGGMGQLAAVLRVLGESDPDGTVSLPQALRLVAERTPRRGIVAVLSDLFDDEDGVLAGLALLRERGHDVVVFQLLDPQEADFPFERMTRFQGMEDAGRLDVDTRAIRSAYVAEVEDFLARMRRGCAAREASFVPVRTDAPLDRTLVRWLAARSARLRRRGGR